MGRFATVLGALVGALTLTACSGGDAVALDPVAHAADRTNAAGSSRMVMEVSLRTGGERFYVNGEGAMDYGRNRGWLLMDFSQLAALDPSAPNLPRMRMLFEDTTIWMRVPPVLTEATRGKPWARTTLGGSSNTLGGIHQPDPSQMLDSLRGISGSVRKVEETRVRGVETTHYSADVSLDKALAQAPQREREAARAALKMFGGMEKMPVDVYIDDAGRVRRMQMEYDLETPRTNFESEVKLELFDFGASVEFERPPASHVAELASLDGR